MKHKVGYNRLGRRTAHRRAMTRNMVTSLFKHERITTTKAKAREIRRSAEKMITRAKVDSVHNRRTVGKDIKDQEVLAKLFTDIGPRFVSRPGGYTRMLKLGPRPTDATEMVILELVSDEAESAGKKSKATKASKAQSKAGTKADSKASTKPSRKAPAEVKSDAQDVAGAKAETGNATAAPEAASESREASTDDSDLSSDDSAASDQT